MLKLKNNVGLIISLLIGLALFEAGWIGFDAAENRDLASSFVWVLCVGDFSYGSVFFAILAALPLSTRYVREYKTGYLKIRFTKQTKKSYIIDLLIKNGLLGGIALALPAVIVSLQIMFHYGLDAHVDTKTTVIMFYKEWASGHELPYVMILIGIVFLCGVTFATLSLGISAWIKNSFLALLIPFALCIFTALFQPIAKFQLFLIYSPNIYAYMSVAITATLEACLLIGGIVLFVTGVYRNEKN